MNSATTAQYSPLCSFCFQVRIYMLQSRFKKKNENAALHERQKNRRQLHFHLFKGDFLLSYKVAVVDG